MFGIKQLTISAVVQYAYAKVNSSDNFTKASYQDLWVLHVRLSFLLM